MRQLFPLLFLTIFLGILIGANIYLTRRFTWFFDISSTRFLYFTFASITIYMIAGLIVFTNATGNFANYAYSAAAILMGFMLYLLLSVLFVDLLNLFVKFPPRIIGTFALFLAFAVSGYGIWNATNKHIIEVEIPIKGLKSEITVVHLSDIHIGHFWGVKTLRNVVDKTNAQNPDVVFITGDLFDGKIRLNAKSLEPLKQLQAPVYFVEGNHDGYSGAKEIKQELRNIGVTVLENEVTHFSELQIIGLNHLLADDNSVDVHATGVRVNIKNTLDALNIFPDKPTVLLHHSPDGIQYANTHGVDLYLAGHTHAGQIFPVNFIAKWMFAYNKGLHDFQGTKIYVSQGVGTFGPPMRVGTRSELALLKLIPE
jgi:predicted MPP superfamily phosphohydrolase